MSRLFGPLSDTTNNVSDRASAFALDQIAGPDTTALAAAPDIFRKSRRFMIASNSPVGVAYAMRVPDSAGHLSERQALKRSHRPADSPARGHPVELRWSDD